MKKKSSLALFAALFAAGILCMDRLPAKAAGEQAGQEQNVEIQDEDVTAQEETAQPVAALNGTCGENAVWSFDAGSGTLTVSGTGAIESCDGYAGISSNIQTVVVEEGITVIGKEVFGYCDNLKKVVLSDSVTGIDNFAFWYCGSLKDITLSDNLVSIGDHAFSDCPLLENVVLPEHLEFIGQDAFTGCMSLSEISIPASVIKMGDAVFTDCSALKDIYFMGGVPEFATTRRPLKGSEYPAVGVFYNITANVHVKDPSWNTETMKDYGGNPTWIRSLYIITEEAGIEVTDKIYIIGSGTDAVIKCSGAAEDFVSLAFDGKIVDPSYYKVESGSTILTVLSVFLDKLSVGDHKVTLNYTYGSVDTVLTIIDRQENTEKPENSTKPADPTKPAGNATGAADRQNGDRKSPQTGEPQTENVWPMTLAILGIGGTALLILKRKTAENRS